MSTLRIVRTVLFALVAVASSMVAQAQVPKVESVFPLGLEPGQEAELRFAGDAAVAKAKQLWTTVPQWMAKRIDDAKVARFQSQFPASFERPGCDVWLLAPGAVSNPLWLAVDAATRFVEDESKQKNDTAASATQVSIPSTVHAQIDPGTDTDYFTFDATQGQRIHIAFQSPSIGGTVEGTMALIDPQGIEVAMDDGSTPEPLLAHVAMATGRYTLRVQDRRYAKGAAPQYRLRITDRPCVVAAYPQALVRGTRQTVTLYGYDLPGGTAVPGERQGLEQVEVSIDAPETGDADGGMPAPGSMALLESFAWKWPEAEGWLRFQLADKGLQREEEPANDTQETAPKLSLPIDLCGQFQRARDVDWIRFDAKKGETLTIIAYGERLGQSMDLEVAIHDAEGKPVSLHADTAAIKGRTDPLAVATLDPEGTWKVPADGEYRLIVRDLFGGSLSKPGRGYRLFVAEQPPRGCVVVMGSLGLTAGDKATLNVLYHGQPPAAGTVTVTAVDLPPGITATDVKLDAKKPSATMTWTASKEVSPSQGLARIRATCEIDGQTVEVPVRAIVPWRESVPTSVRQCEGILLSIDAR